jgi:hypothetical protein
LRKGKVKNRTLYESNPKSAALNSHLLATRRFVYPNGEPPVENALAMETRVQEVYDWEVRIPAF